MPVLARPNVGEECVSFTDQRGIVHAGFECPRPGDPHNCVYCCQQVTRQFCCAENQPDTIYTTSDAPNSTATVPDAATTNIIPTLICIALLMSMAVASVLCTMRVNRPRRKSRPPVYSHTSHKSIHYTLTQGKPMHGAHCREEALKVPLEAHVPPAHNVHIGELGKVTINVNSGSAAPSPQATTGTACTAAK